MAPEAVDDLRTCFHGYAFAIWQLVFPHFGVMRLHPHRLSLHEHLLLLVRYVVMHHAGQFHLVGLGTISMQDHITILQELMSNGFPISLGDWAWTWRAHSGSLWREAEENQGARLAPLDNATPLLPLGPLVL